MHTGWLIHGSAAHLTAPVGLSFLPSTYLISKSIALGQRINFIYTHIFSVLYIKNKMRLPLVHDDVAVVVCFLLYIITEAEYF